MSTTVTCYLVRDAAPHAIPVPGQPSSAGFPHNEMGYGDARNLAVQNSAGRELVVVEIVNGAETGKPEHFKDGQQL
jgi:hypothetical protein